MRDEKMGGKGGFKAPKMPKAPKVGGGVKGFGGKSAFQEPSSAKKLAGFGKEPPKI